MNARRQAYADLLGAAADLRTRVANTAMYGGDEMLTRLAEIRRSAADVEVKAAKVAFAAGVLAERAGTLASAATGLAAAAVRNTNADNVMVTPDFSAFDSAVDEFRAKAIDSADQ